MRALTRFVFFISAMLLVILLWRNCSSDSQTDDVRQSMLNARLELAIARDSLTKTLAVLDSVTADLVKANAQLKYHWAQTEIKGIEEKISKARQGDDVRRLTAELENVRSVRDSVKALIERF